jgi:hypothetical protein
MAQSYHWPAGLNGCFPLTVIRRGGACWGYENNYYLVNQITSDGKALEIILGKKDLGSFDVVGRKILLRFVGKLKSNLGELLLI